MSALLISRPEHNLEFQQRLYDLRFETKDAFDEAKRLEARWKELEKEQREVYQVSLKSLAAPHFTLLSQRFTPQFLLLRLRHSTTAQDEASEELASSFIRRVAVKQPEGDRGISWIGQDVDEFIRDFKESRKIYHKRALWAEKWTNGQVIWRDN